MSEAASFVSKYGDKIDEQFTKLSQLDSDIRDIIATNKNMKSQDTQFDELINSDKYLDLSKKMGSIKQIISSLDSFLSEEGEKGSPGSETGFVKINSLIRDCLDVLVYFARCMNELKIYRRMRQNDSEFVTVRQFETQLEWDRYQSQLKHDNHDIEIIEENSDHQDCSIL